MLKAKKLEVDLAVDREVSILKSLVMDLSKATKPEEVTEAAGKAFTIIDEMGGALKLACSNYMKVKLENENLKMEEIII